MGSIRKRSDNAGKYELDYTDIDGRRYRIDTGTKDQKIAKLWLQKAEDLLSMARLKIIPKVGSITRAMVAGEQPINPTKRLRLLDWKIEYMDRCKHDLELTDGTIAVIHCAFNSFHGVVKNPYIDKLTDEDMRRYRRVLLKQGKSRNTISMYQRALKTAFKRARKWKLIDVDPFVDVELPSNKREPKKNKSMTLEQVHKLLSVIEDQKFKRYIQTILYTGSRRNEVLFLRREDINLERNILYVQAEKINRRLALPINKALQRVFKEMEANGELPESGYIFTRKDSPSPDEPIPWHPHTVTHRAKKYMRKAGLPETCSLHSTRHTYATYLRSKGVPQDVIQRLLGHSSTSTTNIYDHSDALFFRQYADMVDFDKKSLENPNIKGDEQDGTT